MVQAPQLPVSHPMCVPVRSRSSRRKWTSRRRAGTSFSTRSPFTVTVTTWLDVGLGRLIPSLAPLPRGLRGRRTSPRGCAGSRPTHGRRTVDRASHRGPRPLREPMPRPPRPRSRRSSTAVARSGTAATQPENDAPGAVDDRRGGVRDVRSVCAERDARHSVAGALATGRDADPRQKIALRGPPSRTRRGRTRPPAPRARRRR